MKKAILNLSTQLDKKLNHDEKVNSEIIDNYIKKTLNIMMN